MDLDRKVAMEEGIEFASEGIGTMLKDIQLLKSLDIQGTAIADSYTSILATNVTLNQLFILLNELIIERDEELGIYDIMVALSEFMQVAREELIKQHKIFEKEIYTNEKAILN